MGKEMITLELTQDEYDTIWEALSDYVVQAKQNMRIFEGYDMKYNYWDTEYRLAEETLEKIDGKDRE